MPITNEQKMFHPPVNFSFRLTFSDIDGVPKPANALRKDSKDWSEDIYFQSISGLSVQLQTETIKEGGENRFEHVVPTRAKTSDLVLKRGIYPAESYLTTWVQQAVQNFIFDPKNIQIQLLGEGEGEGKNKATPLLIWNIYHAWPKSWKIDELNAEQGKVLIETLELSYNSFKMS